MAFPDASSPIATCTATDCTGCEVASDIHCHFRGRDLARFLGACLPGFVVGGAGLYLASPWALGVWAAICVAFFGFVEIRVMCSHCPHYAEAGTTLGCWANHGSPKLWRYRPGPMSRAEVWVFFFGLAAVWGYPVVVLLLAAKWLWLALFALLSAAFFVWLRKALCRRCMNFACPLNAVGEDARARFLDRNPSVADPWE